MTTNLENIDQRLAQLVVIAQYQGDNIAHLGAEQRERFDQILEITARQAQNISQQTENVRNLTAAIATLARSIDTLASTHPPMLETNRRAVRASESSELLATRILGELRELIEHLRPQD